jgi:hypothetical protein
MLILRFSPIVWTCVLTAGAAAAAEVPLTQGERDFAMSNLHASRKLFLDAVAGLSEAQWNFKPAPDRWSIAECAEHIALSENMIAGFAKSVLEKPAEEAKPDRSKDQKLIDMVVDRSQKAQAPEMLQPSRKFATPQVAVDHFTKARDENIDYMKTTQEPLRSHFGPHPLLGPLDAYQWFLLVSAHSERHTLQIGEVKSDPSFPKK